ncbi:MAG: amino acid adenylation domain-containing protein, partial [bacterium]|nr:amino acid adenylation domain-containing protein [bacterium]
LLDGLIKKYPFGENDVYLFKTSYIFDVSVSEIFGWYMGGGRLVVLDPQDEKDPVQIIRAIETHRVSHINFVPAMFSVFLDTLDNLEQKNINLNRLSSLSYIFLAGEALPPAIVQRFFALDTPIQLENIYGPTESTVYTSAYSFPGWEEGSIVPIGKPLQNIVIYILDNNQRLQPPGVPGELCIGGEGLALGYLNRPGLTADRFINYILQITNYKQITNNNSAPSASSAVELYKTGDLARWLGDGNIEFLGRIDHQVKIRGFRVEPGEIENRLIRHQLIKEAVVIARDTPGGEKYLCSYFTVTTGEEFPDSLARNYLSRYFPDYMVPAYFVMLDHIPLTPSGKVDRKALPEPRLTSRSGHIPPRDETERQLAMIWSQVLEMEVRQIGIHDNFFRIGGHSLKAVSHINRVHKTFDIELPLSRFFKSPTIHDVASFIKESRKSTFQAIEPAEEKEYYSLTNAQKRFFLFQRLEPRNTSYNMPEIILLEGVMEKDELQIVFNQMIRRHESLRTSFHLVAGESVQMVSPPVPFAMDFYDLTGLDGAAKAAEKERITGEFVTPFDLSRSPLLRAGLIKMEKEIHLLMVDMHHIITDGVSMGIFIKEFLALFSGKELPLLPLQYRDYSQWIRKRKRKQPGSLSQGNNTTGPGEEVLNLPYDFVRPAISAFEGRIIQFKLDENETRELDRLARRMDVSLYMLLLSIFNLFLSKVSGQENIVVGSPMAGRIHHNLEGLIGLFINTMVLHNSPSGQKTFTSFLKEVKEGALYTFENQEIQYELLMEKITAARDSGRNPLFDVMFVLQNMEMPKMELPGLKATRGFHKLMTSKFDMTLYVEEPEEIPVFKIEYNTQLFKEETITRFSGYIKTILSSILKEPGQRIADIDFIPQSEKEQLLVRFNQTAVDYPKDTTIYRLFEEQAEKTPDAVLLKSGDRELNYSQLNGRANQLAHFLRGRGVGANHVVGIMLNRSLELVQTLYAVLKAGGTYLPVDPEYPDSRIISMLKESKSSLLITQREILEGKQLEGAENSPEVMLPAEWTGDIARQSLENPEPLSGPHDLIYIIFTSGSTGVPKGAGVFHRGFVNLMNWFVTDSDLNVHDTNLLITSFSFDLTQKNLYASAMSGGIISIPTIRHFDPRVILRQIWENEVTWINCTPSMFAQLVEYCNGDELRQLERLRWVYLGGEPIVMTALLKWLESDYCNGRIVNTYGPTECTDISNSFRVREPRRFLHAPVPIGKPVYNVQNYVLDANGGLLPQGTPGELCIAGDSVGTGYVNDNQLTKEKFVTVKPGNKPIYLYRTGDLVKWLPDGNIEFIGRLDHQVKIRGFRIELGEIEKRLIEHDAVKETLVMAKKREGGDNYLCAYCVPVQGDVVSEDKMKLTPNVLREFLIKELPDYMTPSYFVMLEKMPLNPNGKIDRKALPEPGLADSLGGEYVPPANPTEEQMVELWSEVLDIAPDRVSVSDNFFQLGGHSLKAAGLIARIHKTFSIDVPIAELFSSPTIRGICRMIAKTDPGIYSSIQPIEEKEYYPLSSAQQRLFVIHRLDPSSTTYNLPETLHLNGQLNRASFEAAVKALIQRHESLRTSFKIIDGEPVQKVHDHVDFEIGRGVPLWSPLHGNHSGVNGNNSGVNGNNPGTH